MDTTKLLALQAEWENGPQDLQGLPDRLSLGQITLIPEVFQCRPFADPRTGVTDAGKGHIADLIVALKQSQDSELDPVTVIRVGDRNVLVDGHHRMAAYRAAQRPEIPVTFFSLPGGPRAAVKMVGVENRKTKLTMTAAERSEWAWRLVCSQQFSKSELVKATGSGDGTIGEMRRVLRGYLDAGEAVPATWPQARQKKGGGAASASEQAKEWALALSKAIGPAKTFKTLGKKAILAEALTVWGPRIVEDLVNLLAEELDITKKVESPRESRRLQLKRMEP